MAIEIDVSGLAEARRRLAALESTIARRVADSSTLIEAIVFEAFERQFASNGAEFGSSWRALKPSTIERKRGFPSPERPLVRSGRLRSSLTSRSRGEVTQARPTSLKILNTLPAEEGGRSLIADIDAEGRQVAHPVTGISGSSLREIERLWERIADDIVRAAQ